MKDLAKQNITGRNNSGEESNNPLKRLTVSSIIGDSVFNPQGETLGQIMDIMIDITAGKIDYVIIKFGGFLGVNQKYFAVPFGDLSIDNSHHHAFILNETKESLEQRPGFDQRHWPGTNSHVDRSNSASYGSFMGANTGSEY